MLTVPVNGKGRYRYALEMTQRGRGAQATLWHDSRRDLSPVPGNFTPRDEETQPMAPPKTNPSRTVQDFNSYASDFPCILFTALTSNFRPFFDLKLL